MSRRRGNRHARKRAYQLRIAMRYQRSRKRWSKRFTNRSTRKQTSTWCRKLLFDEETPEPGLTNASKDHWSSGYYNIWPRFRNYGHRRGPIIRDGEHQMLPRDYQHALLRNWDHKDTEPRSRRWSYTRKTYDRQKIEATLLRLTDKQWLSLYATLVDSENLLLEHFKSDLTYWYTVSRSGSYAAGLMNSMNIPAIADIMPNYKILVDWGYDIYKDPK